MKQDSKKTDFPCLLAGVTVSTFGSALYSIAIGIWVLQETGSETLMGLVASISYIISFFVEPLAGAIADFVESRNLLIAADTVQGVTMLLIAVLAYQNILSVPFIILLSIIAAFCNAVFSPASSVLFLRIVPKEKLVKSQSQLSAVRSIAGLVAQSASATLVILLGVPALIFANGISFLLSALSELFISKKPTTKTDAEEHGTSQTMVSQILRDLKAGFVYMVTQKPVLTIILVCIEINVLTAGFAGILYAWILAKDFTLVQYSILLGAQSAAGLVAALLLSSIELSSTAQTHLTKAMILIDYLVYIIAMVSRSFLVVIVAIAISSFTNVILNMMVTTRMFVVITPEHRGKVMGTLNACLMCATGLSMLLYGFLSEQFNIEWICILGGVLMLVPYLQFWKQQNKPSV